MGTVERRGRRLGRALGPSTGAFTLRLAWSAAGQVSSGAGKEPANQRLWRE